MKYLIVFIALFCVTAAFAHPLDEFVILDIEGVELNLSPDQMNEEYMAALKRQQQRRLAAKSGGERFWLFTKAGVEHIIPKGLDHILFVLGLFFSSLKIRPLLMQVTAFTLAHTITLAMAVLDIVQVPGEIVEPLIALSIVWVAVENCVFKKTTKWRPLVVFGFGLLHGLGFASVLSEFGLPKDNFIPALLAFNIGVEVGQLLVLLGAALLFWFVWKKKWYRNWVQVPASLLIAAVGLYWFWERTMG